MCWYIILQTMCHSMNSGQQLTFLKGCQRCFHGISLNFQSFFPEYFKRVSRKCSRCFKEASCCMAQIAATRAEGGLVIKTPNQPHCQNDISASSHHWELNVSNISAVNDQMLTKL